MYHGPKCNTPVAAEIVIHRRDTAHPDTYAIGRWMAVLADERLIDPPHLDMPIVVGRLFTVAVSLARDHLGTSSPLPLDTVVIIAAERDTGANTPLP